jgi:hypothetical protein
MRKKKSACSVRSRKIVRDANYANDGVVGWHVGRGKGLEIQAEVVPFGVE